MKKTTPKPKEQVGKGDLLPPAKTPLTDAQEIQRAVEALASVGFKDFVAYMQSPRKIMIRSFISGVFRGLGIVVGATIVVSFLIWMLTQFVDFPLIGEYFQDLLEYIEALDPQNTNSLNSNPRF